MSDEQSQKPKFEPPPWEQEAFERFRTEQEEARKQAELDEALRSVREASTTTAEPATTVPVEVSAAAAPVAAVEATPSAGVTGTDAAVSATTGKPVIPEARIDSMLIQLKGEEPTIGRVNNVFVNSVIAIFELGGLFTIVEAALLFGKVRATGAAGMLGALASLIMLLVGLGFMGAGFLLFRKHHS